MKMKTKFSENKKQLKITIMKTKIGILVLALCTTFFNLQAQRRVVTTARATSYDISDNLDLDAVASIFGESENLEDFEYKLNDPENRISNLDLNQDGYIDYLRVVENSSNRNSLVVIQAVLDNDVYQDVATIEIEKVQNGNPRVQIVGDSYIYGSDYIIEPVYVRSPIIFSFFWGQHYTPYSSPYYWNYYPSWYSYYRPYPTFRYQRDIYVHINSYNTYNHAHDRNIHFSGENYNRIRRNDYASQHPDRSFGSRNEGIRNRQELNERRPDYSGNRQRGNDIQRSNERQVQDNKKSASGRNEGQRTVNENRRPTYNGQSGTNQTRTRENSNTETNRKSSDSYNKAVQNNSVNRNEAPRNVNENRRPTYDGQSGTNQTQTREIRNVDNNRKRSDSSNGSLQNNSGGRNESTFGRPATRNQSVSTPQRSENRVESAQRNSAQREKSGSVSGQRSSNNEVKQNPQSAARSESTNNGGNNENGNRRR
jgi:hypothetical protein